MRHILVAQGNLAITYANLGRPGQALRMRQEVYSGWLKLLGEEHEDTLREANNYAISLHDLRRFEEAKAILRKTIPVVRRVLRENDEYAQDEVYLRVGALRDPAATLDDLREAVTTLDEIEPTARRVLGGAHPTTEGIENDLKRCGAAPPRPGKNRACGECHGCDSRRHDAGAEASLSGDGPSARLKPALTERREGTRTP